MKKAKLIFLEFLFYKCKQCIVLNYFNLTIILVLRLYNMPANQGLNRGILSNFDGNKVKFTEDGEKKIFLLGIGL